MTLIELMIGIVVIAILFALGAPSFKNWVQGAQIRTSAESILNGLQLAKSAAVNRNVTVLFQLTNTLDATCARSTSGTNWVVSLGDPSNACDAVPDTAPTSIIQRRSGTEGTPNAVVAADVDHLSFTGLGRATSTAVGNNAITITVSNPTGGTCAPGGPMRCMNVEVTKGGRVRMCDPALANTDPQGCP